MATSIRSIPPELMSIILAYLPLTSLLSISATNSNYRALAERMLQELNLAIFAKDVHARLALMSRENDNDTFRFIVAKTTNLPSDKTKSMRTSNRAESLRNQVSAQNKTATDVLGRRVVQHLRSLSLLMYDFESRELAATMAANLPNLKHLTLGFSHHYVHDHSFPSNYWREAPPGSPCWNALVGLGKDHQQNLRLRNLESLHIQRAGLTSAQVRRFVESNTGLKKLRLENVTGVDLGFVQWLSTYCQSGQLGLEEVRLEECTQLKMETLDDFAWLAGITESCVKHLSLKNCMNVRHHMLTDLVENDDSQEGLDLSTLETIVPPQGPTIHFGITSDDVGPVSLCVCTTDGCLNTDYEEIDKIDVDPEYMASVTAAAA